MYQRLAIILTLLLQILSTTFLGGGAQAAEQTILGKKFVLIAASKLNVRAKDATPITVGGDPTVGGATLDVIMTGGTPTGHTYVLPAAGWSQSSGGFRFRSDVPDILLKLRLSGVMVIRIRSDLPDLPNPATYAGAVLAITNGDKFCANFGGAALGVFKANDATRLKIAKPQFESVCPTVGAANCGDGIIQMPFETCDGVDNDDGCPGECRAPDAPFECTCPFCGDLIITAPEVCDHANHPACEPNLCASDCTQCAVCLDAAITPPEQCDTNDDSACTDEGTTCRLVPGPNDNGCFCRECGDEIIDPGEDCDDPDLGACTEGCSNSCECAVCLDGVIQSPVENCDTGNETACTDQLTTCRLAVGPGGCRCRFCGDGYLDPGEDCDGAEDLACPGECQGGCVCPVTTTTTSLPVTTTSLVTTTSTSTTTTTT